MTKQVAIIVTVSMTAIGVPSMREYVQLQSWLYGRDNTQIHEIGCTKKECELRK